MSVELARALFETTLATSVAIVMVLLLRGLLMRRLGAGVVYRAWLLVPIAGVAMMLPARTAGLRQDFVFPSLPPDLPGAPLFAQSMPAAPPHVWMCAVWALGAATMLGLLWRQQHRFERGMRDVRRRADGLREAAGIAGLPAVVGMMRPAIVLPVDFDARYDATERELILTHERIHLRRHDPLVNTLAALVRVVFWFNPLIHYGVRRFRADQELACDECVIAQYPHLRRRYAEAMLKTSLAVAPLPAGCHWRHAATLQERIVLMREHAPGPRRSYAGGVALASLCIAVGCVAWAAQSPEASAPPTRDHHPPSIIHSVFPAYPAEAVKAARGGSVVLVVDVAADGSVAQAAIANSDPAGLFDAAALAAVRQWKFRPASKHGKPVASRMRLPMRFDPAVDSPGGTR